MRNVKYKLTVLHDDNSAFTDHSRDAADYSRNSFAISMVAAEDYIMVGYDKPINAFYPESEVASTASELTGEYWNGTAWASLEGFDDDSRGFSRSGFVQWDRDQIDEAATTIDSKEMYWYRIAIDSDSSMTLKGLNIILCDIGDLLEENPDIADDYFLPASGTYINYFVNARNRVVERLRQQGYTVNGALFGPWDLLDIHEVRQAATYYTMFKIYFNLSDASGDELGEKALFYRAEYSKMMNMTKISVDSNDDGKSTGEVQRESKVVKFSR